MLIEEFTIWLSGMPGAGKSTLAMILQATLERFNVAVQKIDAEFLTKEMARSSRQTSISEEMLSLWHSFNDCQKVTIIDSGSLKQEFSRQARVHIKNFVEIYLECPPPVCLKRTRGRLPQNGTTDFLPWHAQVFVAPEKPELRLDTEKNDPERCSSFIVTHLMELRLLGTDEEPQLILERLKSLGYIL